MEVLVGKRGAVPQPHRDHRSFAATTACSNVCRTLLGARPHQVYRGGWLATMRGGDTRVCNGFLPPRTRGGLGIRRYALWKLQLWVIFFFHSPLTVVQFCCYTILIVLLPGFIDNTYVFVGWITFSTGQALENFMPSLHAEPASDDIVKAMLSNHPEAT